MKQDQIKLGGTYLAKVTDKVVSVRLDAVNPHGGWDATNLATGKKVRIKSAQRLRGPAPQRSTDAPAADPDRVPLTELDKQVKAEKKTAKKVSALDLAAQILKESRTGMHAKDICELVIAAGWKTSGKTPAATLYSAMIREIAQKKDASRFRKTARGEFEYVGN